MCDRIEHEPGLPEGKWNDEERRVGGGSWNRRE